MVDYRAGQSATFEGEYYNQFGNAGVLADPSGGVSLTVTYGTGGTMVAGPFVYSGASVPTAGEIYRISPGVYALDWQIPYSAAGGIYVMNWLFTDGPFASQFPAVENINVSGGGITPPSTPDLGYWTGSLSGNGVTIPFGGVDANGGAWILQKVDGWDGAPTVGGVAQQGGDHGGIASPQYYGPRPITLTVYVKCASQAARDAARAMMQQAVDVNSLGLFVYNEPEPKQAAVRRAGILKESPSTLLNCVFSVLLVAPDPRKYGTQTRTVVSSATGPRLGIATPFAAPVTLPAQPPLGLASVVNGGNFETRPVVAISGPIIGPGLYNASTGQSVRFSNAILAAGDVLTVDFQNRVADLNGSTRIPDLASAWWVLAPGETQIMLQGSAATGSQMTITYQDAWM